MRVSAMLSGLCAADALTACGSGFSHDFNGLERLPKLPSNFPRSERQCSSAILVFYVDELIAKSLGVALQICQHPIPILVFIRLLSRVHVCRPIPQHALDQPSALMRGCRHSFWCPEACSDPTLRGPQGTVTVGDALGRQP